MKSEIHILAEAILANTLVLKMLVEKLPDAAKVELAKTVQEANPTPMTTPVTTVPAEHAPVTVPVTVTVSPVVAAAPESIQEPIQSTQKTVETPVVTENKSIQKTCPFVDQKGLIGYVMDAYKQMGQTKGAKIQDVLNTVGIKNINETRPDQYQALFDGVEAIRNV